MDGLTTEPGAVGDVAQGSDLSESWFGGFPEELRGNELISAHESPESLAKDYLTKNNELSELRASLPQLPESPDAYQFEIPDGVEVDNERMGWFKQFAFENKITNDVAAKLVSEQLKYEQQRNERAMTEWNEKLATAQEEAVDTLKKEWGVNYDKNLELASLAAKKFLGTDANLWKFLEDSGFGDNPELVKAFYKVSQHISEDVFVAGDTSQRKGPRTDEFGRPMIDFPSMEKQ